MANNMYHGQTLCGIWSGSTLFPGHVCPKAHIVNTVTWNKHNHAKYRVGYMWTVLANLLHWRLRGRIQPVFLRIIYKAGVRRGAGGGVGGGGWGRLRVDGGRVATIVIVQFPTCFLTQQVVFSKRKEFAPILFFLEKTRFPKGGKIILTQWLPWMCISPL